MSDQESTAFFRPRKLLGLLLIGLLAYLVVLALRMPAGWLWQQVSAYVRLPPTVQVRQVSGTLWDGAAGLSVAGYPLRLLWQLRWPQLSGPVLPVDIRLETARSHVQGRLALSPSGSGRFEGQGRILVAEFEDMIRRSGGAMIEGEVELTRLHLVWQKQRLAVAEGLARWPGGRVTWPMGTQTGVADFPPMLAELASHNGDLSLSIREQGGEGPAADVQLLRNAMMDIRVYKRMVDLAGQPWPDSAQASDVVFRVRQPLLPGSL